MSFVKFDPADQKLVTTTTGKTRIYKLVDRPAFFFQPFCGNKRNWIFRHLEFREKILEFSEKSLSLEEKILEFSRKILEFREKLLILGNKIGI